MQLTPQAPGLWLLISLLFSVLLLSLRTLFPPRVWIRAWFAHWLLVPYLGLLTGGLSPRLLGLAAIDWLASMGLGVGLTFGVLVLLMLVRAFIDMDAAAGLGRPQRRRLAALAPGVETGWHTITSTVLWGGITQFHWVFLRGGIWEMLLAMPHPLALPGYWAVWLAFAIGLLELLLLRAAFIPLLIQSVTLITTGILYFYTHNFWLCWTLHVAIQLIVTPPAWLPPAPDRLAAQQH